MSSSKIVLRILRVCIGVLIVMLVIFGLMRAGSVAYDMGYRVFTEQPVTSAPGRDMVVEVKEGTSALSLGKLLEEKGLVRNAYLFMIQMNLSAYAKKVKPGVYTLNTSQTPKEMLIVMSAGPKEETTE